jgi:hypothetical protein
MPPLFMSSNDDPDVEEDNKGDTMPKSDAKSAPCKPAPTASRKPAPTAAAKPSARAGREAAKPSSRSWMPPLFTSSDDDSDVEEDNEGGTMPKSDAKPAPTASRKSAPTAAATSDLSDTKSETKPAANPAAKRPKERPLWLTEGRPDGRNGSFPNSAHPSGRPKAFNCAEWDALEEAKRDLCRERHRRMIPNTRLKGEPQTEAERLVRDAERDVRRAKNIACEQRKN